MTNEERIQSNNAELLEAIEQAENLPDAGGGDASHMVVTFTTAEDGTLTPSHTYEQITEWVNNGGSVALTNGNTWYNLAFINKSQVWFERTIVTASSSTYTRYIITSMGYMDKIESNSKNINVTAEVGQTIIVKEVDENGKPTAWEAVDHQPRTHWQGEKVMVPEHTFDAGLVGVNMVAHGGETLMGLTVGKTYIVVFDGVTYECVAEEGVVTTDGVTMISCISIGNLGKFGGTDNGRPFVLGDLLDYDPPLWACVPYEYGEHTLSVTGVDETHTIPEKYVSYSPAFPYYIEVTGSGTTDDPFSCNETFAEVVSIYESGREIKAKKRSSFNNNDIYWTQIYDLTAAIDNVGTLVGFYFVAPVIYGSNDYLIFALNEDGSFNITDTAD